MIRRLVAALAAACFAWLGCLALPQPASATPAHPAATYTDNGHHAATDWTRTPAERGPPATYHHATTYDAVNHWPDGVSARSDGPERLATYDDPAGLAQLAHGTGTTREQAQNVDVEFPVLDPAGVATNTGDDLLPIGPASEKVWTVLNRVEAKGAPLPGYKGGRIFENTQGRLPQTPGVTYREWDVNPYVKGVDRGLERLVTGSDGSAYFTSDHYETFMLVRGPTG